MKNNKLSKSQIIAMLNEGVAGVSVNDLCRQYHISTATYYNLKVNIRA